MDAVVAHIVEHLDPNPSPPLFIAVQGPQGSGKTYLSAELKDRLSAPPYALNVALLSIDDLYLTHDGLVSLASQEPPNALWAGRGQPGTHDVGLGVQVLEALRSQSGSVELPRFDKSLFNGEGDRLSTGLVVTPPFDIVILEGWCVGFFPIPQGELERRWEGVWREVSAKLGLPHTVTKHDLERVNETLKGYVAMWSYFDIFVQIKPTPVETPTTQYSIIYRWRLEQEHNMKALNGGHGMSDDAVKSFVDRYIPGYVFFGDIPPMFSQHPWTGNGLRLLIDEQRHQVGVETF
ncbi:putative ATP-dependent kinase TDA10 [Hypsizygus marmoreus]|uniref:ATP-dependent kinase TDA10 n=1 Tax=Hypsizygus marmoreus TaxID=39966 RepID=A0A369JTZ6_HYPMA|nr:putative ATP-dependent kinase TDA10 [Hypsizygus marmoreus]